MNEHWGNTIWRLLHVLVEKIDTNAFNTCKGEVIDLINYICENLPCNICSFHYKKKYCIQHEEIFHFDGLKIRMWDIHNSINSDRRVATYNYTITKQYMEYCFQEVYDDFYKRIGIYKTMDFKIIEKYLDAIKLHT
jgi:hypothetical protein